MRNAFAISVDRATQAELNQIHEVIKANANGWWHRHLNFWIVGDGSALEWRNLIKPYLVSGSSVLVLKLPAEDGDRNWAYSGPNAAEKCKWIHNNYS